MLPDDMCVLLTNYGAGVAIIDKISLKRPGAQPSNSLPSLLAPSAHYDAVGVSFVQDEYCMRPGDTLSMATATANSKQKAHDALRDWIRALEGVEIQIDYRDVFGKHFSYVRTISTKGFDAV